MARKTTYNAMTETDDDFGERIMIELSMVEAVL